MIEATGLTKHYRKKLAVDQLSFTVRPEDSIDYRGEAAPVGAASTLEGTR